MTPETNHKDAIWEVWNALPDGERSPVHFIAAKLQLPTAVVAAVVFPTDKFGGWHDDHEPVPTDAEMDDLEVERCLSLASMINDLPEEFDHLMTHTEHNLCHLFSEFLTELASRIPDVDHVGPTAN